MTLKCKKCGHEWTPRTTSPAACPACKNYNWDKERKNDKKAEKRTR